MAKSSDQHTESTHGVAHEESTPSLFTLDPGVGIWAIVVFILLLVVLKKMAWKPILSFIEKREKGIRESLEEAKKAKKESKLIAEEQVQILTKAKADAVEILSKAKEQAAASSEKLLEEGHKQKELIIETGHREVNLLKKEILKNIRNEAVTVAVQIAEKLIQETLDEKKQQNLLDKHLKELDIKV